MPLVKRTRPRIGDVVEIDTGKGLAYAQFTHKHVRYGAVLRTFGALHAQRPNEFASIVRQTPQFTTCFPLGAACARGIVNLVASEAIEPPLSFPTFRAGVAGKAGTVDCWWLWDGKIETRVGSLAPGMENYPIREIVNDTMLVERILAGWRHEDVT